MAGSYTRKTSTPSKGPSGARQSSVKGNSSILNFFQKTDTPPGATSRQSRITQFATKSSRSPSSGRGTPTLQQGNSTQIDLTDGLFLEDKNGRTKAERATVTIETTERARSRTPDDFWGEKDGFLNGNDQRFSENDPAVKRRKMEDSPSAPVDDSASKPAKDSTSTKSRAKSGPFIDESDSEDDMDGSNDLQGASPGHKGESASIDDTTAATERHSVPGPPPLVREDTSYAENDELANFDDLEEDELVREEFRERPWEDEEEARTDCDMDAEEFTGLGLYQSTEEESACPICQTSLTGLNETVRRSDISIPGCADGCLENLRACEQLLRWQTQPCDAEFEACRYQRIDTH